MSAKCKRHDTRLIKTERFEHDTRLKNNVGENIAISTNPDANPITIWKNSAGHKQNMLDRDYRDVGMAMATNGEEWYYVIRFK